MAKLGDLPSELINLIVFFLDKAEPPSSRNIHQEPSFSLMSSDNQPLKKLSQTCRSMRNLTFRSLFRYCRVCPTAPPSLDAWSDRALHRPGPGDIIDFLDFIVLHRLQFHLQSVVLFISTQYLQPDFECDFVERLVHTIVDAVNPEILTIILPPRMLSYLVPNSLTMADSWAFEMPLHIFRLTQPWSCAGPRSLPAAPTPHILQVRPWNSCVINEGSSAKAYNTYEYFNKCTPSILQGGHFNDALRNARAASNIKNFDYIAVFPLATHVFRVVQFIQSLENLDTLRIRLGPDSSNFWSDDAAVGRNPSVDLWMDYESNYRTIITVVSNMGETHHLKNFTALDYYYTPDLLLNLDDLFESGLYGWHKHDKGLWKKNEST